MFFYIISRQKTSKYIQRAVFGRAGSVTACHRSCLDQSKDLPCHTSTAWYALHCMPTGALSKMTKVFFRETGALLIMIRVIVMVDDIRK